MTVQKRRRVYKLHFDRCCTLWDFNKPTESGFRYIKFSTFSFFYTYNGDFYRVSFLLCGQDKYANLYSLYCNTQAQGIYLFWSLKTITSMCRHFGYIYKTINQSSKVLQRYTRIHVLYVLGSALHVTIKAQTLKK